MCWDHTVCWFSSGKEFNCRPVSAPFVRTTTRTLSEQTGEHGEGADKAGLFSRLFWRSVLTVWLCLKWGTFIFVQTKQRLQGCTWYRQISAGTVGGGNHLASAMLPWSWRCRFSPTPPPADLSPLSSSSGTSYILWNFPPPSSLPCVRALELLSTTFSSLSLRLLAGYCARL